MLPPATRPLCGQALAHRVAWRTLSSPSAGAIPIDRASQQAVVGDSGTFRPSHLTMTLPYLDRAFDVIFMVAGDNKAGIVHKFS